MRNFLMGVAAIALAAGGAHAQSGNGKNDGNGGAKAKAVAAGPGNSSKGQGNSGVKGNAKAGNGNAKMQGQGNAPTRVVQAKGNDDNKAKVSGQGNGNVKAASNRNEKFERDDKSDRGDFKEARYSGNGKNVGRSDYDDGDRFSYDRRNRMARDYGLIDGCPPGLAKKQNGCNPPGLVKRDDREYDRSNWWGLPGLSDGRYRYYDNNLVRLSDAGSILGYYPLLGGALSAGNVWPSWFDYQPVPDYYESYYGLGSANSYRYADNALYRIDPETSAITSIAALLTGDTINVGQPMPSGYSVYNVPYGYRDRYADGPNAMYRYSDGYVYEVDPATMLVRSIIETII